MYYQGERFPAVRTSLPALRWILRPQSLRTRLGRIPVIKRATDFLIPPVEEGTRLTLKRLLNLYMVRYQYRRGHTRLRGYPILLTLEAGNVCNLRCPACFTGAGEVGRVRSFMTLDLYRRILAELGPYLFRLDFYNWGEPLLSKDIFAMIEEAKRYGIATNISTNFSIPFDAERAERLVASGLDVLGVSLDGATQATYEQYRVRGNIETVLANCRLVNGAKRKLDSKTPRMIWEYHIFDHNTHEIEQARSMARELEMDISIDKGWVIGNDWDSEGRYQYFINPTVGRCDFLWQRAVVQNDGGVAPCCGTFYQEDDFGKVALRATDLGERSFAEVWNNEAFQQARGLFRSRDGAGDARKLVCYDCPATVLWENYQKHLANGLDPAAFKVGFTTNDGFNYFFNRKPDRAAGVEDLIELQPVDAASR